jgi:hypothetical protein
MAYNVNIPLIFTDVYCLHVRDIQVRHRRFPEIRGEGRSIPDAVRHLMAKLNCCRDFAQGEKRTELEGAIAEVASFHSPGPQPRSTSLVRRPRVGSLAIPAVASSAR